MDKNERDKYSGMSAEELASERTAMADERTALANQRTFSAWLRTGLSSILAGLAIVKFIGKNEYYKGYVVFIGILFVTIGIGIYILAYHTYRSTIKEEIERGKNPIVFHILTGITGGMILTGILIAILLLYSDQ